MNMMKFTPELFSLPGFCCEVNQIRYYVLGTRTNQGWVWFLYGRYKHHFYGYNK
nr:hypothetical protein [Escherichia coli]